MGDIEAIGPDLTSSVSVRPMLATDGPAVLEIYRQGIEAGTATFETEVPSWKTWDRDHLTEHRFVALRSGAVVGWVALSRFSSRAVFDGVAEVSLYVADVAQGLGVGRALMGCVVESSEDAGMWTLVAGIFPDNEASLHLHQKCGFELMGTYQRLGQLHGRWLDVMMLQRRRT